MQIRRSVVALTLAAAATLTLHSVPADAVAVPVRAVAAKPAVSSLSLTYGSIGGGASVTVTGTNFTGVTAVKFGATAAPG